MQSLIYRKLLFMVLLIIGSLSAALCIFIGGNFSNQITYLWFGLSVLICLVGLSLLLFGNIRLHIDFLERQVQSLHSAIALSNIKTNLPTFFLRHAVAPDFIELISEIIRRRPISRVLELGCGASSIYMAYLLSLQKNGGHLVCLEENPAWRDLVQSEISAQKSNLARIEIFFAPLVTIPEYTLPFYDVKALKGYPKKSFDMLVIDGPGDVRMRRAALPLLKKFLSDASVIILDDGDHPHMNETINKWLENNVDWRAKYYKTIKGTWLMWNNLYPFDLGLP